MITTKLLQETRVLVVGVDVLTKAIARLLLASGVREITFLSKSEESLSSEFDSENFRLVQKDPEVFIVEDVEYFKSFDLAIAANQPRPFELALSDARWQKGANGGDDDKDLPMMVMRSVGNNCKMRCQYRGLPLKQGGFSTFVSLPMDLLPWTDEKRQLVASVIENGCHISQTAKLQAYCIAARAVIDFQESKGMWPSSEDVPEVAGLVKSTGTATKLDLSIVYQFVKDLCEGGLASVEETITVLAQLVATDAVKLLTGSGQPVNNTNIEEVIKIVSDSL